MSSFSTRHGEKLLVSTRENLDRFESRAVEAPGVAAAVALTLLPDADGEACFLLTRRGSRLVRHRGQWALPGGRLDEGESTSGAALRELAEEVGLRLEPSAVLGRLDDYATRSGFVITPIVVWCEDFRELHPDPHEVAKVYRVPVATLDRPDVPMLTRIPQSDRPVLSMPILGQRIHAPTAAIVYQFLEVALRGRCVRVAHYEQPVFAWR